MSTQPAITTYAERTAINGLITFYGSFQGNSTSDPDATLARGGLFTATHVSTGLYKVALSNPPLVSLGGTATNGIGLAIEPYAWVTSESETAATAPQVLTILKTSRVTTAGAFHIWVYSCLVGVDADTALYDVTTADRVNFAFGWKNTDFVP